MFAINWPFSINSMLFPCHNSVFFLFVLPFNLSLIAMNRSHFVSFVIFYLFLMILPCASSLVIHPFNDFMICVILSTSFVSQCRKDANISMR